MPKLRRADAAAEDLIAIWTYIALRNPSAADGVLRKLDAKSASLARSPGIGAPRPELGPGICVFPVGRYLIFYREIAGGIEVLRYLHSARDVRRVRLDRG